MKCPCKDCNKRVLGCHSNCDEYISFAKHRKEELDLIRSENRIRYTSSSMYTTNKKLKKKLNINRAYAV